MSERRRSLVRRDLVASARKVSVQGWSVFMEVLRVLMTERRHSLEGRVFGGSSMKKTVSGHCTLLVFEGSSVVLERLYGGVKTVNV